MVVVDIKEGVAMAMGGDGVMVDGVVVETLVGAGAGAGLDLHNISQFNSLQRHTMHQWSVPDACAMDTLRPPALATLVQGSIRPKYLTRKWKRYVPCVVLS